MEEKDNIVFIQKSAPKFREVAIGDSVMIKYSQNCIVKKALGTNDENLTPAYLTKNDK